MGTIAISPSPVGTLAPQTAAPTVSPTATLTQSPSPTPTSAPSTNPPITVPSATPSAPAYPTGSVIVTFKVGDEQYRVLVIDPTNIAIAQKLLTGQEAPPIPNGIVVRGDHSVNTGWSWHIDPDSLEFAEMTTEVCDGKPSYVENGSITGGRFCPWSAKVVAIDPANP